MKYCKTPVKFALFFCLIFFAFSAEKGVPAQKTSVPPKNDEAVLRNLKEIEWAKAYREQDTKLLDRILADEFQMIDNDGNWSNKKLELEYNKNNKPLYDSFRFEIKRLDIFENGTAIIAGTGHITGKDKDGEYKIEYQSSNVLIKRNGIWKAISSHVSGVKRTSVVKTTN
jgi:ketosteroid isomerase-like protein